MLELAKSAEGASDKNTIKSASTAEKPENEKSLKGVGSKKELKKNEK